MRCRGLFCKKQAIPFGQCCLRDTIEGVIPNLTGAFFNVLFGGAAFCYGVWDNASKPKPSVSINSGAGCSSGARLGAIQQEQVKQ
jgi:hypothetical protein